MASRRDRHPLRAGALLWPQKTTWPELRAAALLADAAGLDSLWTWDHLWRPYLDLGFTHVIADLGAPYDHETIERLPRLPALMAGSAPGWIS